MRKLIYVIGLLFPLFASAQFKPAEGEDMIVTGPNCQKFYVLKTSVTGPLQQQAPLVRLALEMPLDSQHSIQPEVGYIYQYAYDMSRLDKKRPSYEVSLSGRYYLPRSPLTGIYTGPRAMYRVLNFETGLGNEPDGSVDFSNATHHSQNDLSLMWELGLQPVIARRLAVNFGLALGPKFTYIQHSDLPNQTLSRQNVTVGLGSLFSIDVGYVFCH